jgi:hypothetical protein
MLLQAYTPQASWKTKTTTVSDTQQTKTTHPLLIEIALFFPLSPPPHFFPSRKTRSASHQHNAPQQEEGENTDGAVMAFGNGNDVRKEARR